MRRSSLSLRGVQLLALVTIFLSGAGAARAADCGDDVGGRDVPCACGDTVVSDLVLDDDPVLAAPCPRDGLVVRVPYGASGLRIDLAGGHVRGGRRGTGVRILAGGEDGVVIVSSGAPALVEGFRDGLVSQTSRYGLRELVGVHFRGQDRDGVRIYGDGHLLRDIAVTAAQRDGVFVRGDGWTIENVVVRQNGRHGLGVMGAGNVVRAAEAADSVRAEANAGDGIRLWGDGNLLFDCVAAGNGESGVGLNGVRFDVRRCEAVANGAGGVRGNASQSRFFGNVAVDNFDSGIGVHGHAVFDAGGNLASGTVAPELGGDVLPCRLGLEACQ